MYVGNMARPKALELSMEYPNRLLWMIPQQEGIFACVRAWVAIIPHFPRIGCTDSTVE
jgi:hypothetical protein